MLRRGAQADRQDGMRVPLMAGPVAVIGAGPVGLAAAAQLVARGETPVVLEAGDRVGEAMLRWGHVRLFSPWQYTVDVAAEHLLREVGWERPNDQEFPTGRDLVERYLAPLAALPQMKEHLRLGTRVLSVTRLGFDRARTPGREEAPFVLRVVSGGLETEILARAVIDASGTYDSPNPVGAGGTSALGEQEAGDRIFHGIPDVLGANRARYAGRRVLVVGSGHSAFNVLLDLATLAHEEPGTRITWAIRRDSPLGLFGGGAKDELPERGRLGVRVREMLDGGLLSLAHGFRTTRVTTTRDRITLHGEDGRSLEGDTVVAATGFRPDNALLQELRVDLDPIVESPSRLAPLIDPNVHSCGTVPPHGEAELRQPEKNLYIVGMKSYGRAPTFLMLTGYEQVRSVVSALTGDLEGAREVRLVLPATGVCGVGGPGAPAGDSCCGDSEPEIAQASRRPDPVGSLQLSPRAARGCC